MRKTPFFALNANHEMMAGGRYYFHFLDFKRKAPRQAQEGSYFALRIAPFQLVGIDTAYHRDGRLSDPELRAWLERVLLEGRSAKLVNILLSSNEPYELGKPDRTTLLEKDLAPLVFRPPRGQALVDFWFFGNTHHCSLHGPTLELPFFGSCIGHGGHPYERKSEKDRTGSHAPVRWFETESRFPWELDVRRDRGNNGYLMMRLSKDGQMRLTYKDWRGRERHVAHFDASSAGVIEG
jgi:hypothetical protein